MHRHDPRAAFGQHRRHCCRNVVIHESPKDRAAPLVPFVDDQCVVVLSGPETNDVQGPHEDVTLPRCSPLVEMIDELPHLVSSLQKSNVRRLVFVPSLWRAVGALPAETTDLQWRRAVIEWREARLGLLSLKIVS